MKPGALNLLSFALALSLASGQEFEAPSASFPTGEPIFGTPGLKKNAVLFVPTEGTGSNSGSLIAFDLAAPSPSQIWKFNAPDWIDSAPAIAEDGTLYTASWNGVLYAIHPDTGSELWSFDTESILVASPAVAPDGTLYIPAYDGFLYAIHPDGSEKWSFFIGAEMDSSPSLDNNGRIFVGTYNGTLHAIDPDGSEAWSFTADDVQGLDKRILASPAVTLDGQVVFGAGNGFVYSLDANTGVELWNTRFPEEVDSSPVLDDEDNIYFGTRSGFLVKLDSLGIEQWALNLGDIFFSSPLIDAKGNIYVVAFSGNNTSTLYAFRPDGTLLAAATFDGVVDASPVLTPDGRLIVCTLSGDVLIFDAGFGLNRGGWPKFGHSLANTNNPTMEPSPSGLIALFETWEELGSGWTEVEWLSAVFTDALPWIYHPVYGWLYSGGPGISEFWFYQPGLTWLWTRPDIFPYAYSDSTTNWIFLAPDDIGQGWYYDFSDLSWKILQL